MAVHEHPKKVPPTDLTKKAKNRSVTVKYAVSYLYNGGTVIGDDWYPGYEVPPPIFPEDTHELVGIGVGYQLNARPPLATAVLRPKQSKETRP